MMSPLGVILAGGKASQTKSKRALKAILAKCTHLQALQPLLREAPVKVQKYVLKQFASILPHDVEARRAFVQNGGLQFLQGA